MRRNYLVSMVLLVAAFGTSHAQESLVAMDLGPAFDQAPKSESDWRRGLTIDKFFLANGENVPVTPTAVSLVWDNAALHVQFRCADPDAIYRNGVRVQRSDQVEVGFVAPGAHQQDLWQFDASLDGQTTARHAGRVRRLPATTVEANGSSWSAEFTIPWTPLGGLPAKPFLLQLSRMRGITGEVLSPGATDFHDAPGATDEFIEVTLGGTKGTRKAGAGLIMLPSGTRRWERRALLHRVGVEQRKEIAHLQQVLDSQPTTEANLETRVRLAEYWYDLLDQEGMSFHRTGGAWTLEPGEFDPWTARHKFNDALRAGNTAEACRILDSLLKHLNRASASWFADGTPGDVNEDAWTAVTAIDSAAIANNQLVLHSRLGQKSIDLFLSFPSLGGVRLHGPTAGFFTPDSELPIQLEKQTNGARAKANDLTVDIGFGPSWRIALYDAGNSQPVWLLRPGGLAIHARSDGQIAGVDLRGDLKPEDKIVGLGERFDALDQRGKTLTLWQTDAWDSTTLGGLSNQAYKPIPLWQDTTGYAVFWNTSYEIRADFGEDQENRYRVTAHGPILDLYIWPGTSKQVLQKYTALTGRPLLPPAWAFEPWMGGGIGRWAEEPWVTPIQNMVDVAEHFRRLDIPHSAIYAEGPSAGDPLLFRKLVPMNIRVLTWGRSQAIDWSMAQIKQALPGVPADQLPLMRVPNGEEDPYHVRNLPPSEFPYIDFTDPNAIKLYRAFWKDRLDLGISGSMADFSDLVPRDALFHDGSSGEKMHNWYVHFYQHAMHEVFAERRGNDFILFGRAAAPGTQVDAGQMAGDHASNFRGLDESLTGGLSVSTSGFSNWGSDIGGYQGKGDDEVYQRWIEFGAFSPLMRFHGTEPREPWFYSDAAVVTYKKFAWVRENLLPYIYGSAQDAHAYGIPMMRSMPNIAWDEYMFGDDLLVAPVHAPGEHRTVVLPAGHWTDLWTGAPMETGRADRAVPLDTIPVYVRAGALIPLEVASNFALGQSMSNDRVHALLITPPDAGVSLHNWKLPDHSDSVELRLVPDSNGFAVTVENWRELEFVLVCGIRTAIRGITVDGEALPELKALQAETLPPGWMRVGSNEIVVRLPIGMQHVIHFDENEQMRK